jgi:hypothetical protein
MAGQSEPFFDVYIRRRFYLAMAYQFLDPIQSNGLFLVHCLNDDMCLQYMNITINYTRLRC